MNLMRSDITEGLPGLATKLFIHVVQASTCLPVANAAVDVWHANAPGAYSGFGTTVGQTWLRGVQNTDPNGLAVFNTIYPGWYMGRTQHIHVKVRPTPTSELTTQLYFRQALNTWVNTLAPYSTHGQNPTTNAGDMLFLNETVTCLCATGADPSDNVIGATWSRRLNAHSTLKPSSVRRGSRDESRTTHPPRPSSRRATQPIPSSTFNRGA